MHLIAGTAIAAALALSACHQQYAYVPTTNATAEISGREAADYAIPPAAPQGDVRLASYGITEISPQNEQNQTARALHLRVVLADAGNQPWTFDTRLQRIQLAGRGQSAPAFASANRGAPPPLVTVPAGGQRVVDLFFPLPPDLQHADRIPEFDAVWHVMTSAGEVSEQTPFERLAIEPDYDASWAGYDYGSDGYWGGPYWYNPDYPYYGYGFTFAPAYFGHGFAIHRAPHFVGGAHGGGYHGGGGFHGGGGGHR